MISVLVPTRGRVERLRKLLDSYWATCTARSEFVFRVDEDDTDTLSFLHQGGYKIVVGPRLQGYGSLPLFFNEMVPAATGSMMLCGNDDMVFKTVGWDRRLLEVASKYSDDIYNLGVMTHNYPHYPFSTVSRRVVSTLGFIWDPRIFWGDIFLRDTIGTLERNVEVHDVEIEHDWAGFKPDQTHLEGRKYEQNDSVYWNTIHRSAVADAVAKLRPLLQQREVA